MRPAVLIGFTVLLAASLLVGLSVGAVPLGELLTADHVRILTGLRLPRVLLAAVTGALLGLAGLVLQTALTNPLAEPYTIGISGGAALGAGLAGLLDIPLALARPVAAAAGCLLAVASVVLLSERRRFSAESVVLAGIVTSHLLSSLVLLLYSAFNPIKTSQVMLWLMGDLSNATAISLTVSTAALAGLVLLLALSGPVLDILAFGDEKALSLGLRPAPARRLLFTAVGVAVSLNIAFTGIIAFVGVIVPQLCRRLLPGRHADLLPASALAGASFLVLCDALGRSVARPAELPVGVVTGLCGGLFFLASLLADRR